MRARIGAAALCVLAVLVACGGSSDWSCAGTSSPRRPHVILYLIDALRSDHLGIYGYARPTSPNIDKLARESAVFARAYAQASWTRPSVGSLLTSRFPSGHGALRRDQRLRMEVPTLAELLRDRGYATAAFLSNPNVFRVFGFGRGFDIVRELGSVGKVPDAKDVHAAVFRYLERRPPRAPLFLYVHTMDPHYPYDPPPPYDRAFPVGADADFVARSRSRYDGEIAYADRELGRFLEVLRQEGLYEDSLLILLSDHGEEFGEHGFFFHGRTLFEEQLRVPLLIRFPGGAFAGARVKTPVRVLDLLPTIAEVLEIAPPEGIDGTSLLPLLSGAGASGYAATFFAEQNLDEHELSSLVEGDHKLIVRRRPRRKRSVQLFDLARDPREQRDLASARPQLTARLRQHLAGIEADFSEGLHLRLSDAGGTRQMHRVSGSFEMLDGATVRCRGYGFESSDRLESEAGGAIVRFDLLLKNFADPAAHRRKSLVDEDHIRCRPKPPNAGFRLALSLEGPEGPGLPLWIGDSPREPGAAMSFEARADDPRLAIRARPPLQQDLPVAQLYAVPGPEGLRVDIDESLDARLRALGYLGTEAPPGADPSRLPGARRRDPPGAAP